MDPFLVAIVSRVFERLFVVAVGALAIYLGYRLFVNMPEQDKGSGKVLLPGGISIYLSRVGPGVFFSLFGAIVIGLSFHYGIKYDEETAATIAANAVETPAAGRRSFSGIAPSAGPAGSMNAIRERNDILLAISALNRATGELRDDLPADERRLILKAIHDSKLRLMQAVWDPEHWGAYEDVAAWLQNHGVEETPPRELAEAVQKFHAGSPAAE